MKTQNTSLSEKKVEKISFDPSSLNILIVLQMTETC